MEVTMVGQETERIITSLGEISREAQPLIRALVTPKFTTMIGAGMHAKYTQRWNNCNSAREVAGDRVE